MADIFFTPIEYLKGVGTVKADILKKELGIFCFNDLLTHYPFRYIDRSKYYKINQLNADLPYIQFIARVSFKEIVGDKHKKRLIVTVQDDTGELELIWFQTLKWVEKNIQIGKAYIFFGKPSYYGFKAQISHPEFELYTPEIRTKKGNQTLQPVYNSTEKLKQFYLDTKGIQRIVANLLDVVTKHIVETLPDYLIDQYKLFSRLEAIQQIHFPVDAPSLQKSQFRLKFEELFFIQLKLLNLKLTRSVRVKGHIFQKVGDFVHVFYQKKIPFELTAAQKKVIKEIRINTADGTQMNRLVQGDVGSGKTIVALMSMLLALDNGYQTCMMAPTEILAQQHYQSLKVLLGNDFVKVELLTGSVSKKNRKPILEKTQSGEIQILVGTHALIEETVEFKNLGLAVIDEQHRFGVEQRAKLWKKNVVPPHILVMTATPIPRTLAMTLYGDLDVSVINQLPEGRKPIHTVHFFENQRLRMIGLLRQEIAKGRQVYIVYPLIHESEKLDLLTLMEGVEHLSKEFPLPHYRISIVHGKLKKEDKDFEMQRFVKGDTQLMVATTVIEVGVNVPNASVMVVENAERFGLAQLHQLRGRVGRSSEQSYCILMTGNKLSKEGKIRMETMVRTTDGFEISEVDLKLRGPGNLEGTQQSGILDLKLADLARDQLILQEARACVEQILSKDPQLDSFENKSLKNYIENNQTHLIWNKIS